jgi:hypothetical protein
VSPMREMQTGVSVLVGQLRTIIPRPGSQFQSESRQQDPQVTFWEVGREEGPTVESRRPMKKQRPRHLQCPSLDGFC